MTILLHGFTGAPSSWDALGLNAAVALPLLGHAPHLIHTSTWREEIERLLGELPDGSVHVVGYSMGARVALGLACHDPRRIDRLTLVGVNPGIDGVARAERVAADAVWRRRLDDGIASFASAWEAQPLFASQRRLPEAVRAAERARRLAHDPVGLALALDCLGLAAMPDLRRALETIPSQVTLVAGDEDARFRAIAERMAPQLRTARVRIVAGAGHNVILERPRELAALIEEKWS